MRFEKATALRSPLIAVVVLLGASQAGQAATYYWDTNGTGANFGSASGTWGSSAFWSVTSGGGSPHSGVTNTVVGDILHFGNGSNGLGAGTINVTGAGQGFTTMTFASGSGAITISGGTSITMGAASTITVNNAADTIDTRLVGAATSLTKAGTGKLTLGGLSTTAANNYSGTTILNGGTLAITGDASLSGGLTFSSPSTLDLTNGSATFAGVMTATAHSATTNTISIGSGQTLTITNSVNIGSNNNNVTDVTKMTVSGGGTWNVTASGTTFRVGGGGTTLLDMSGLANFTANLGSTGIFRIGGPVNNAAADDNSVVLAVNSTITAGRIDVGNDAFHTAVHTLALGTGVNTLNADLVNIGALSNIQDNRGSGEIIFSHSSLGSVKIRAANGTSRAAINMVNVNSNSGVGHTADLLLAGHNADILASTLTMALQDRSITGNSAAATLTFDAGNFDVTTIVLSSRTGNTFTTGNTTGDLSLGGGLVTVGTLTMSQNNVSTASTSGDASSILNISGGVNSITTMTMGANAPSGGTSVAGSDTDATANFSGGTTAIGTLNMGANNTTAANGANTATSALNISGTAAVTVTNNLTMGQASTRALNTATASINITGGSLIVGGNIQYTNAGSGVENNTITLNGGLLDMTSGNIGASGATITINAQSGTLQNLAQLNGGTTPLTKSTGGTLILTGTNAYTGGTTISGGTIIAKSASALGSGNVSVAAGTGLSYAASANTTLNIGGTLSVTGGAGTTLGGSIGSTTTSARVNVTGVATISNAAHTVNIYGVAGTTPATGTYTLIQGAAGSSLNPATAPTLGTVYNNTNFTVGAFTRTATTLQVGITAQTAITTAYWKGGLAGATDVWAASNGTTLSNWTTTPAGAVQALVPGAGADVIIAANSPTTSPTNTRLGADMSIKSLTISSASGLGLIADGNALTIGTGGVTMNSGVVASTIAANVVLGTGQTWTNNSANLLSVSGNVTNGVNTLSIGGTGNMAFSGVIGGGAGGLTKSGAGTLELSGVSTYTGVTTINAGVLEATFLANGGTASSIGQSTNAAANLVFGAPDATLRYTGSPHVTINRGFTLASGAGGGATIESSGSGTLTFDNTVAINYGTVDETRTLTLGGTSTTDNNFGTTIVNNGAGLTSLVKADAGTWMLSGTVANTYTGLTTVNAGTLKLGKSGNVNAVGGNLTIGDGIGTDTVIMINANQIPNTALVTIDSSGVLQLNGKGDTIGRLEGSGLVDNATSTALTLAVNSGIDATFSGNITQSGGGVVTFEKQTTNVVSLTGTGSTYTGLNVNNGTLEFNNANALGAGTAVRLGNTTTGAVPTLRYMSSATVAADLSGRTFTINQNDNINATIDNAAALAIATLDIGNVTTAGADVAKTFTLTGVNTGNNTVSGIIQDGTAATSGLSLTKNGTGTWVLSGANSYTGVTNVNDGILTITNPSALGDVAGNTIVNSGDGSTPGGRLRVQGDITVAEPLTLYGVGNNGFNGALWNSSGNNTWSGLITLGSTSRIQNNSTLSITGGITGSQALTFSGGTTNISTTAVNNGTSTINVHGGTLVLNVAPNTWGMTQIAWNGTLRTDVPNALPSNQIVEMGGGTANMPTSGTGTFNLNGNNQTIGGLRTQAAVLAAPGSSTRTITSATAATLTVNQVSNTTFDGSIQGAISLIKSGIGTLTLTGSSNYTGTTNVDAGTLLVNGDHSTATGLVTVAPGATLGGNGTIGGVTLIQGTHSPGTSPGIQSFVSHLTYEIGPGPSDPNPLVIWELVDNTVSNSPNVVFDTIVVGGDLNFADPTTLSLNFDDSNGSAVDWSDAFWATSHTGVDGWLLYDVAGTIVNFDSDINISNFTLTTLDWLDSLGMPLSDQRLGASFRLTQIGSDIYLEYNAPLTTAVPETEMHGPLAIALAVFALLIFGRKRGSNRLWSR